MASQRPQPKTLRSAATSRTRHAKPAVSYREPPSDLEDIENDSSSSDDVPLATKRARKPKTPTKHNSPVKRLKPSGSVSARSPKTKKFIEQPDTHLKIKQQRAGSSSTPDIHSEGVVPPWNVLPYQLLIQIMHYASYPLYDEFFQPNPSLEWLLQASRLCRSFSEPALTILYRTPALVPMVRAHKLCQLLGADQTLMTYNYRAKVERLQMDVSQTAAYTLPGFGLLDLHALVYNAPRLSVLELYHQKDMAPYKRLDDHIKWSYPDQLFEALANNVDGTPTRLRSWRWSARLTGKLTVHKLKSVHETSSFSGLQKLAFVNYQVPMPGKKDEEDPEHERELADAIGALPNLKHLIFESSTLLNSKLLPLLPTGLQHLELTNCWEVTSDEFSTFLESHGRQLQTLTLNHNQSLNLSFLQYLGLSCPHLLSLQMNLTYYNIHSSYHDSDPLYEYLIHESETPSWPSTLQTLELFHLRRWDIEQAEMFFQSLLDSAENLQNLRYLTVKAILNIAWRDRVSFRDKWEGAFERVFKRHSPPPNPHLRSLGAYRAHKQAHAQQEPNVSEDEEGDIVTPGTSRQIGRENALRSRSETSGPSHRVRRSLRSNLVPNQRITGNHSGRPGEPEDAIAADSKAFRSLRQKSLSSSISRELRILDKTSGNDRAKPSHFAARRQPVLIDSESDDEPLARTFSKDKGKKEYIQALCEIVDIRIDNLRPTETQFGEADFLDSEPEGDDDWNGGEDFPGDGGYAW